MASSGRYQSQLFNFLHQQTQKLSETAGLALRHLKVGAIWGTQILLYPVYAIYQTTRLTGRQLQQTVTPKRWRLPWSRQPEPAADFHPLASDTPVQRVLAAIAAALPPEQPTVTPNRPASETPPSETGKPGVWQSLTSGIRSAWTNLQLPFQKSHPVPNPESNPKSSAAIIPAFQTRSALELTQVPTDQSTLVSPTALQGVACSLPNQALVLVLVGNVVLDVLTPKQQQQLRYRIFLELAISHQQRRQYFAKAAPMPLAPAPDRPTLLAPVRVFRQLMAWLQTGPIAVSTNLFQESVMVWSLDTTDSSGYPDATEVDWFIPQVPLADFNPAHLLPRQLPPATDWQALRQWLVQVPQLNWEAMVWAAIRYFFGDRPQPFLRSGAANPQLGTLDLTSDLDAANSWLAMDQVSAQMWQQMVTDGVTDGQSQPAPQALFSTGIDHASLPSLEWPNQSSVRSATPSQPALRSGCSPASFQPWSTKLQSWLQNIGLQKGLGVTLQPLRSLSISTASPGQLHRSATFGYELNRQSDDTPDPSAPPAPQLPPPPSYIDTAVTQVEYVKSPWRRLIGWLDRGVMWLEGRIVHQTQRLWQWLRGR